MATFTPGGRPRFRHQRQGIKDIIRNRGVHALLWDPGVGKTATVLDYASLLAMKSETGVVRVLVLAPLAAIDTWVEQSEEYVAAGINVRAEALGGSIRQRAEVLSARGRGDFAVGARRSVASLHRPSTGPLLNIVSVNLDSFKSRASATKGGSRTMADVMVAAVKKFDPDLIVVDECHPAGTMVSTPAGPRPIEELKIGDQVLSFNESGIIVTTVKHTFNRETEEPLWTLGETRATPEHPVWTMRGFVPISEVETGDQVLRAVPRRVHDAQGQPEVLFEVVLKEVHVDSRDARGSGEQDGRDDLTARGAGEVRGAPEWAGQPSPRSRSQGSGSRSESGSGVSRFESKGRQRGRSDLPAETSIGGSRLGDGTDRRHRLAGTLRRLAQSLQDRRRQPRGEGGRGDRRGITSGPSRAGRAQGQVSAETGLDRVSLHQPAGDDRSGISRLVYNIETEAGTYFAEGLLVHNSHRIKGATSNVSKAVARLTPLCRRRIILTGTVMPHSPLDVFGQWRFLDPEAFGTLQVNGSTRPATFSTFKGTYAVMGGWMGKEIKGFTNLDRMQDIMARNSSVARKTDALDLPPVTDTEVTVDLSTREAKAYAEMKKALGVALESGALSTAKNRLAQMMRLRQITSGYLPDDSGALNVIGDSKARVISSLVHDTLAGEKRVVVFAHFRHETDLLVKMLAQKGTEVVTITGDTKPRDRSEIRHRFGSSDPARIVLVAQVRTMSLAVNELVTASHAIFGSLPNQRDEIEQARARLDRQGQDRPVTIWTTVAPGTVDAVILQSYRDRTDLETSMLAHVKDQVST